MVCILFNSSLIFFHILFIFYQSYTQKRPSSKKMDKDTAEKAKSGDSGGDGGDVKSNGASTKYVSRARGTSDAKWRVGRPGNDVSNFAI
jgi:hypothetical protein